MTKEEKRAILIAFSVKSGKFESQYERNKFFRGLYGWKQMIRKEVVVRKKQKPQEKVYTYRREGLLDEIPHEKVDQSSFIVPEDEFDRIEKFFKEWRDKVMWKAFKVLLDEDFLKKTGRKEIEDEVEEW
ncbi:MAG: hypothetical protein QXX38_03360 [Candidatus Aenigmatarchaeota archaeon]